MVYASPQALKASLIGLHGTEAPTPRPVIIGQWTQQEVESINLPQVGGGTASKRKTRQILQAGVPLRENCWERQMKTFLKSSKFTPKDSEVQLNV